MMTLKELRAQSPQYDQFSDGDLAVAMWQQNYANKGVHIKDFLELVDPSDSARFTISDQMWPEWERAVSMPRQNETPEATQARTMGDPMTPRAGDTMGATRALGQGMTLGAMDEIVGAGAAALHPVVHGSDGSTLAERYSAYSGRERNKAAEFAETNPKTAAGLEMAGMLAAAPAMPVARPFAGAMKNAATTGALYSGAYGALASEPGQRVEGAKRSAALGAATGAALPLVARGLGWLFRPSAKVTPEQLKEASQGLIKRATDNGLVINPGRWGKFILKAEDALSRQGYLPANHQGVANVLSALKKDATSGVPFSAEKIPAYRAMINGAVTGYGKDPNGQKALHLLRQYDDFIDKLASKDVVSAQATPTQVSRWLKQHRALWRRFRNSDKLERLSQKAELTANSNQATDYAQALRTQYRQLAKRIIDGKEPSFNQAERDAIMIAATGHKGNRAAKVLSKMRFDSSGNLVGAAIGATLGNKLGGPKMAAAIPAIGNVASAINNRSMERHALNAFEATMGAQDPTVARLIAKYASPSLVKDSLMTRLAQPIARGGQVPEMGLLGAPAAAMAGAPRR